MAYHACWIGGRHLPSRVLVLFFSAAALTLAIAQQAAAHQASDDTNLLAVTRRPPLVRRPPGPPRPPPRPPPSPRPPPAPPLKPLRLMGVISLLDSHSSKNWILTTPDMKVYALPARPTDARSQPIVPGVKLRLVCFYPYLVPTTGMTTCLRIGSVIVLNSTSPLTTTNFSIRLLVMVIDVSEQPDCPAMRGASVEAVGAFYNAPGNFTTIMRQCSYGKVTYRNETVTVLRVTMPCTQELRQCNVGAFKALGKAGAVLQLGVRKVNEFNRYSYVVPFNSSCPWDGLSYVPGVDTYYRPEALNKRVVLQETLHNFGVNHGWRNGVEYHDPSTPMGLGSCCPSAPELWRVSWITLQAELSSINFSPKEFRTFKLPATFLGPDRVAVKILPDWLGDRYLRNIYLSFRSRGLADQDLSPEFNNRVSIHVAEKDNDKSPSDLGDPRYTILGALAVLGTWDLNDYRLIVRADVIEAGPRMVINICRYESSSSECVFMGALPPFPNLPSPPVMMAPPPPPPFQVSCPRPAEWCTQPGEMPIAANCDRDFTSDWACISVTGQRKAIVSSRGCSADEAVTGWPNASSTLCPLEFTNVLNEVGVDYDEVMKYSWLYCGDPLAPNMNITSDKGQAVVIPLSSIRVVVSVNNTVTSILSRYIRDSVSGPVHGGGSLEGEQYTVNLDQSLDPVVAVSACCSGYSRNNNTLQQLILQTASGRQIVAGNTQSCSSSQEWDYVPIGYMLGGVETKRIDNQPWVNTLQYLYVPTTLGDNQQQLYELHPLHVPHLNLCYDIKEGAAGDGVQVIQWGCNDGINQRFRIIRREGRYFTIEDNLGRCMTIPGGSMDNAVKLEMWQCQGWQHQQFLLENTVPAGLQQYVLKPRHSLKCISVAAGSQGYGTDIIQWECITSAVDQSVKLFQPRLV